MGSLTDPPYPSKVRIAATDQLACPKTREFRNFAANFIANFVRRWAVRQSFRESLRESALRRRLACPLSRSAGICQ